MSKLFAKYFVLCAFIHLNFAKFQYQTFIGENPGTYLDFVSEVLTLATGDGGSSSFL